ncbi:MAG: PA14 domain-containing protein [Lentimonas sp.]
MAISTLTPKKQSKKLNSTLLSVIVVSGLLHLILIVVLGGITIVEYILVDDAEFEAPDPIIQEEPPPDMKVKIKLEKKQLNAQPLKLQAISQIAIDDLSIDLPSMADSFTVNSGLGSGGGGSMRFGGGIGSGGMAPRFPDIKGFGTTSKTEYAWEGTVYLFKEKGITYLLDDQGKGDKVIGLRNGRRQGKEIYNYVLNLPEQSFTKGFPGVTDQFEWFAIDFELDLFWPPELAGNYEFKVQSDDGAVLFIDRKIVLKNDGQHAMETATGTYNLEMGKRKFRLAYFQGPKTEIGLIVEYRKVGEGSWKLFDSRELIKYQIDF